MSKIQEGSSSQELLFAEKQHFCWLLHLFGVTTFWEVATFGFSESFLVFATLVLGGVVRGVVPKLFLVFFPPGCCRFVFPVGWSECCLSVFFVAGEWSKSSLSVLLFALEWSECCSSVGVGWVLPFVSFRGSFG